MNVLDTVSSPFIILLAINPHMITKAIEPKLNQVSSYLRNMVHLPFFLQNSGLSQSHSWYETEKFPFESDDQGGLRRSKKKKLVGTESLANSPASNLNKITPEYEAADKCHLRDGAAPQGIWKEVEPLVEFDRDRK